MNAGNVGCSWPGKCRCLRKETRIPARSSVVPIQTTLQCCWDAADDSHSVKTVCRLTNNQQLLYSEMCITVSETVWTLGWSSDGSLLLLCYFHHSAAADHLEDLSMACPGQHAGPGTDYSAFLSCARCSSTPPQAYPSAWTCSSSQLTICVLSAMPSLAVTLRKDKSSLCSANLFHP